MIFINMKQKYTKQQLQEIESKILNEQPQFFPGHMTAGFLPGPGAAETLKLNTMWSHEIAAIMSILTLVVPVIGPALSSGIMGMDAWKYHEEGNDEMAGLMAIFAAIPVVGRLARLGAAPLLRAMTPASKKVLAGKILAHQAGKKVAFTKAEQIILKDIAGNPKLIQQEMKAAAEAEKVAARKAAQQSLRTKMGKGVLRVGADFAKYEAIAIAWSALYAEIGLNTDVLAMQLRPKLENIKRAVIEHDKQYGPLGDTFGKAFPNLPGLNWANRPKKPLAKGWMAKTPGAGWFEQIVREEYRLIKEGVGDSNTPKDYSRVRLPFMSVSEIEMFRNYAKEESLKDTSFKKDYDRLKNGMKGASATVADKEFYSLHKNKIIKWWDGRLEAAEKKREESGTWDLSYWMEWGLWVDMVTSFFSWLKENWVTAGLTAILASKLGKSAFAYFKGKRTSTSVATIGEAKALSKWFKILPRLRRNQIEKLLRELGADTSKMTKAELEELTKNVKGSAGRMRSELEKLVSQNRMSAADEFLRDPNIVWSRILRSWLTEAEHKAYTPYIEQYIRLTEKYGNASWATKWFR